MVIYKSPVTKEEFSKYFYFRWEMLRKPLNFPPGSEQDEFEESSFHIAAYDNSKVIGVGRLHIESNYRARIRYMAVHQDYQKQGVGSQILNKLEHYARNNDVQICWLHARKNAINFYMNNEYMIKGNSHSELLGLHHERMEKQLN